ncbi:MAG TPA: ABC transporter substrate-binding protein [Clostridia bacterium]|nr:ABC transporter substrate-binding protein [Clostridia bacterium]
MARKIIALLMALLTLCALIAGCKPQETTDPDEPGTQTDAPAVETTPPVEEKPLRTELVISVTTEWEGSDLYQISTFSPVHRLIADTLFVFDQETGELTPSIASALNVSEDGKTVTVTIPEGKKFANGEPLLPEDVKRSVEWGLEISPYNSDYQCIESIDIDGNDVIFNLSEYSQCFMFYLQSPFFCVIDKDQIDTLSEEELLVKAMPYGPFYITEYVPGSHITLARNEYYTTDNKYFENKGIATLEKITARIITESFTYVEGLKSGEINVLSDLPVDYIEEISAIPEIVVQGIDTPGMNFIILNKDDPLFADINVRKAIALAINREQIGEVMSGLVEPAYSFVVPSMMDYDQGIADYYKETYCNDVEQAKQLLAAAGWADTDGDGYLDKDGQIFEFSYTVTTDPTSERVAQIVQLQLKDIGVKLNIEAMTRSTRRTAVREDTYQATVHEFSWAEPSSILPYLIHDNDNLENQAFYDLAIGGGAEPDAAKRVQMFADAQKILMDELAYIPLFKLKFFRAYRTDLDTIVIFKDGAMYFNDIRY